MTCELVKAVSSSLLVHSLGLLLSLQHTVYPTHLLCHGGALQPLVLCLLFCRHARCHTTHMKATMSLDATAVLLEFQMPHFHPSIHL